MKLYLFTCEILFFSPLKHCLFMCEIVAFHTWNCIFSHLKFYNSTCENLVSSHVKCFQKWHSVFSHVKSCVFEFEKPPNKMWSCFLHAKLYLLHIWNSHVFFQNSTFPCEILYFQKWKCVFSSVKFWVFQ